MITPAKTFLDLYFDRENKTLSLFFSHPPFVKKYTYRGGGDKVNFPCICVKIDMKIWKNYNYEEERLYSTGNDELDELLERAFCEGYEYAQREYAEKKSRKEKREEYLKELRELDDEELNRRGWKAFRNAAGYSTKGGINAAIGTAIFKGLSDPRTKDSKLLKTKAGRIAVGTLGATQMLEAGMHGKAAVANARTSRAVKLEKRRRKREEK